MLGTGKPLRENDLPRRIANELLTYIRLQRLHQGDRLPPQIELADQLRVSRTSLREALARLEVEGLIRQVHGVGTFVAGDPFAIRSTADMNFSMSEMIAAQGMTPGTSEVNIAINTGEDVPAETTDCLGLEPGEEVMCLERVRTADGKPFAYVISYIVTDLEGLSFDEAHYQGSLYEFLQSHCSIFISDVDAAIEACVAEGRLCDKLEVPAGSPLLVLHQCHRDLSGRPIVASLDYIVQNSLRVNIKRQRSGHLFLMEE